MRSALKGNGKSTPRGAAHSFKYMSDIDPKSWQEISPYLDRALDLPESERAQWLASFAKRSPAIAARLEELLDEYRTLRREKFLENDR